MPCGWPVNKSPDDLGDKASGLVNRVSKLLHSGPSVWRDCARAVLELAWARYCLATRATSELIETSRSASPVEPPLATQGQEAIIARIALTVPNVARYMPFRSDCLVQALAARRWLARHGIASGLSIGVRKTEEEPFAAHAWLEAGGVIVTGGDISGYTPLTDPGPPRSLPPGWTMRQPR